MKHIKTITVIAAICVIAVVLVFCGCSREKSDATSSGTTTSSENLDNMSLSAADTMNDTQNSSDGSTQEEKFRYDLKSFYSSRKEVQAEREALTKSYLDFGVGKTNNEILADAEETYNKKLKVLGEWLDKYPPDEEEILEEKERLLNQEVGFREDSLYQEKNNVFNRPLDEAEECLKKWQAKYDEGVEVQRQYENGEITIDEALEKLEIEPSNILESLYELSERYDVNK